MREADRLKTFQAVVDRMARVGQAARRLGLSTRQLERLIPRYKDKGVMGLVSRKRGQPNDHQLESGIADRASNARLASSPWSSTLPKKLHAFVL